MIDNRIKTNWKWMVINPKYYFMFLKVLINRLSKTFSFKKNGISGHMRVHNEGVILESSIESIINILDELIITHNDCTDESENIIIKMQKKYPNKIKVFKWNKKPFIYWDYSNFGMKKCKYRWYMKVDADQIYYIDKSIRNIILNSKKKLIFEIGGVCPFVKNEKYSLINSAETELYIDENKKKHNIQNDSETFLVFSRGIFDKYIRVDKTSYCEYIRIYDYKRQFLHLGYFFIHYIYLKRKIYENGEKLINIESVDIKDYKKYNWSNYAKLICELSDNHKKILQEYSKSKRKNFHYEDKNKNWGQNIY